MNEIFETAQKFNLLNLSLTNTLLVVAPHQDDESLGCGGTIALATQAGFNVVVLFVTDGSQSHPSSLKYPHQRLIELREQEACDALTLLGVKFGNIHFMRLPDGSLPFPSDDDFAYAAAMMKGLLQAIKPGVIYLPWRRDPHRDHRATWEITKAALFSTQLKPLIFEYFIWLFERAANQDNPAQGEGTLYYIDITTALAKKTLAIMAHVSQTTNLIDDDENGFTLSPSMLHHFENPKEYFIQTEITTMESKDQSLSENYFDEVYRQKDDPWDLATSDYERDKYRATVDALPLDFYNKALEIGCSIGLLTEVLLQKCHAILAIDVADAPVRQARERLKDYPQATIKKLAVPKEYPEENFDLVVMSEVGYFFSIADLNNLQQKIVDHLKPSGQLLLVHWTPFVPDFPLTGDEVHEFFMEFTTEDKPLKHLLHQRTDKYRLDLFEKR